MVPLHASDAEVRHPATNFPGLRSAGTVDHTLLIPGST